MYKCRDHNCIACVVFHVVRLVVILSHSKFTHNHPLNDMQIKGVAVLRQEERVEIRYLTSVGFTAGQIRLMIGFAVSAKAFALPITPGRNTREYRAQLD
jgi:hypothetical protein